MKQQTKNEIQLKYKNGFQNVETKAKFLSKLLGFNIT